MTSQIELTILMPCLNEAETIEGCIREANSFLNARNVEGEILIADNGSTDRSIEKAEALGARVIKVKDKGYGNALRAGIADAQGKYIIMGDSDMSYDFYHLDGFLEKLRDGDGLVMGNRFRGGIAPGAMPFSHRYLGVPVLSLVGRIVYQIPVGDFHCGLRGMNTEAARSLGMRSSGMEFASEMIGAFAASNYSISEIPTVFRCDGRSGKPHLRSVRDGMRHLIWMYGDLKKRKNKS